ncbi:MAG TPA: CheR family methyltransferase, partial [Anaeromyxobacteraceae bacterium]
QLDGIASYARYLQENPQEQDLLFNELLIGVTSFFRDPAAWEALRDKAFPALFSGQPRVAALRAWIPACSTGEEAYSLAIVFKEALEKARPKVSFSLQIFATDLDRTAIERARQGVYPTNIASDVSPERLRRFFLKEEGGNYRVGKEIREMVILAPQDVIRDPPFTKLDVLICRNLLIYLEPELQQRLVPLFHYSLNPGGILFLGTSETVGGSPGLFAPLDQKLRLYRRKESAERLEPLNFPSSFRRHAGGVPEAQVAKPAANLQTLADELILRQFGPAGALVNDMGDIFYVSGRTGKYLEPAAGKANWNIFAMAREGLRHELVSAVQKVLRKQQPVKVRGLTVDLHGGTQDVEITVRPLREPNELRGMFLVIFGDAAAAPTPRERTRGRGRAQKADVVELQRTTKHLHEELRSTREDMQTSQEELRSANEELQSTNEELQSTNEELTTSKEEMQSMNEELQTVNVEMQAKLDELSRANNDMKNLLNSTEIATLFLDRALRVRRFTPQTTRIMKLMARDVGRPVTDITSDLVYPGLAEDVLEVLRTLVFNEKEITTGDGRWYSARIMPYRTVEEVIDGVVITFAETTAAKLLEAELRNSRERFSSLIENLPSGISIRDESGQVVPKSSLVTRIADAKAVDLSTWKVVVEGPDAPDRGSSP